MGQRHLGPKYADAASDSVGVIIQLFIIRKSRNFAAFLGGAKTLKIKDLSSDNDIETLKHSFLVFTRIDFQRFNDIFHVSQQFGFTCIRL